MRKLIYQVNSELEVPIYQQLVDSICTAIKRGDLAHGQKLPTVQELSGELGIARGTIKRAYDELEYAGLVEKVQGRGTFVSYRPVDTSSRKEQAMAAIDAMLAQLDGMGFTATEINIFLNLRLRQLTDQEPQVKIAVVECNPENLSQITEHLRKLGNVDLYSYLLDNVQQYPYVLGEDMDLVVTTAKHADYVESILPVQKKIARVALRLSNDCFSEIIHLQRGQTVGILSSSLRFGKLLHSTCQSYTEGITLEQPEVFSPELDLQSYLRNKDVVLVPRRYEKYCTREDAALLNRFAATGRLISCAYELDEGSYLYLEIKTKRLLESKQ